MLKKKMINTYCKINNTNTCLSDILSRKKGKCKKIKEKNKEIDVIKEGAILVSGNNTVDGYAINGIYLVTFENYTNINNVIYENIDCKIWKYLKNNHINNFEIIEYIETKIKEMKLENINILAERMKVFKHHSFLWYILVILLIMYIIYRIVKFI